MKGSGELPGSRWDGNQIHDSPQEFGSLDKLTSLSFLSNRMSAPAGERGGFGRGRGGDRRGPRRGPRRGARKDEEKEWLVSLSRTLPVL